MDKALDKAMMITQDTLTNIGWVYPYRYYYNKSQGIIYISKRLSPPDIIVLSTLCAESKNALTEQGRYSQTARFASLVRSKLLVTRERNIPDIKLAHHLPALNPFMGLLLLKSPVKH